MAGRVPQRQQVRSLLGLLLGSREAPALVDLHAAAAGVEDGDAQLGEEGVGLEGEEEEVAERLHVLADALVAPVRVRREHGRLHRPLQEEGRLPHAPQGAVAVQVRPRQGEVEALVAHLPALLVRVRAPDVLGRQAQALQRLGLPCKASLQVYAVLLELGPDKRPMVPQLEVLWDAS